MLPKGSSIHGIPKHLAISILLRIGLPCCWEIWLNVWSAPAGPQFNIKMSSYQYRKSHCGDKTVVRSSCLHNGISYTGKVSSLYWIGALDFIITWPNMTGKCIQYRANSWFAPSQWETALLCNDVSHWLRANLELALKYINDNGQSMKKFLNSQQASTIRILNWSFYRTVTVTSFGFSAVHVDQCCEPILMWTWEVHKVLSAVQR